MARMPDITCAADCAIENLPVIAHEDCAPKVFNSEIQQLNLARQDAIDFTDVSLIAEWEDRLSENNTPPDGSTAEVEDLIRPITVIGDIPAPTRTTRRISGDREITTETKYVINFEIDDLGDANWQFGQKIQCGKGSYPVKVWPVTKSGHVLGGNTGIIGKMAIDHILDRGVDGVQRLVGTITFTSNIFANRDVYPMAA